MRIGADVGGSAVKLICTDDGGNVLSMRRYASDGSAEHLAEELKTLAGDASLDEARITVTGVGSGLFGKLPCKTEYISEFEAFSRGGQIIAHKENALIVSMGTGTAFVMARRDKYDYLGGSGVGGGTLCGLSLLTTGEGNIYNIKDMTRLGNTSNVDLTVGDISVGDVGLPADLTAANFGKADIDDSEYDIAAGLANMIYQSVGVMAAFALKGTDVKTAVFVGAMSEFDVGAGMLRAVGGLHGYEFIMPRCGAFAGAYGCAVTGLGEDSITAAIEREMEKIRNGAGKY